LPVKICRKAICDERGATAIEYGLIATLIALAVIGTLGSIGTGISDTFTTITAGMNG
jgi:pilus assembly protein Flp/PilA